MALSPYFLLLFLFGVEAIHRREGGSQYFCAQINLPVLMFNIFCRHNQNKHTLKVKPTYFNG